MAFKWEYKRIRVDRKTVLVHRHLMEKKLGRKLKPFETVHHKDGNQRNNEVDNLELMTHDEHAQLHSNDNKRFVDLTCNYCGVVFKRKRHRRPEVMHVNHTFCGRRCMGLWYWKNKRARSSNG